MIVSSNDAMVYGIVMFSGDFFIELFRSIIFTTDLVVSSPKQFSTNKLFFKWFINKFGQYCNPN